MMVEQLTSLEQLPRSSIVNSSGQTFLEFRKTLRPKYFKVWIDVFGGYVGLCCTTWLSVLAQNQELWAQVIAVIACSVLFGYIHAYIQLFLHEAAHYNIAQNRKLNDRLANAFIGIWAGQDIKTYRPVHLLHHRWLGTPQDTEHSYFDALSWRYILESLTGIKVFTVLLSREKLQINTSVGSAGAKVKSNINIQLFLGMLLHIGITTIALYNGLWILAVSWIIGMGVFFPFFGAVRQLLEHRSENAVKTEDYGIIAHGATNRLFGDGLFASTFGGAGFNRHLLHHWDAGVSYTNFRELETFLLDTVAKEYLLSSRAKYIPTFFHLFGK